MTRPLRIDFPGAVYHVTSRGNRRSAIFEDDTDASLFLKGHEGQVLNLNPKGSKRVMRVRS